MTTLDKLTIGQSAQIKAVNGEGSRRQHFLDMGLIPDAVIKLVKFAPLGDPMEVMIHGYALTLRKADASLIEVEPCSPSDANEDTDYQDENLNALTMSFIHTPFNSRREKSQWHF